MIDIGKDLQNAFDDGYKARDAEIVRCKNCKHFINESLTGYKNICGMIYYCDGVHISTDENGYCFMAERREDNAIY